MSPHEQILLSEILEETWVSQISIKATIPIWYYRILTAHETCFYNFGHWILVIFYHLNFLITLITYSNWYNFTLYLYVYDWV